MSSEIIVIGGGPAGLMAALRAAQRGRHVTLYEQLPAPGRKLLATGGGRCNLTTTAAPQSLPEAFGRRGRFTVPAMDAFGPAMIRAFFLEAGVATMAEDDGAVFPVSQRAGDVLNALLAAATQAGVRLVCGSRVTQIISAPGGRIRGVQTSSGEHRADHVILAAGGRSWPALGGNGSGHALAAAVGLSVVTPTPALVPLVTEETWPGRLSGLVLPHARLRLIARGASRTGESGALLFTHRGLSGPAALQLSGAVAVRLLTEKTVTLSMAAMAECDASHWLALFEEWRRKHGRRLCHNLLSGELPRALAETYCQLAGLEDTPVIQASRLTMEKLAAICAAVPLTITATEGWDKAIVTRGGVGLEELDPRTMACRRFPGLYCCGEVVDIDGPCGGYNLTWALASGHLAGTSLP